MKEYWYTKYPIAHRGWHWVNGVDENSWEAIELAVENDVPIEFDVHLSSDGVPYVHHDFSFKRMTGLDQTGDDLSIRKIKKLKTHNSSSGVPVLKDVLEFVQGKVPLVIDVKRERSDFALEESLYELLRNYKGDFSIQSFHPSTLNYFRKNRVNFPLGLLSGSFEDEDLNLFVKVVLKSLCLCPFLMPNYIGHQWSQISLRAPQEIREKYEIPLLGWTVRDEKARRFTQKWGDNIIFEDIEPQRRLYDS